MVACGHWDSSPNVHTPFSDERHGGGERGSGTCCSHPVNAPAHCGVGNLHVGKTLIGREPCFVVSGKIHFALLSCDALWIKIYLEPGGGGGASLWAQQRQTDLWVQGQPGLQSRTTRNYRETLLEKTKPQDSHTKTNRTKKKSPLSNKGAVVVLREIPVVTDKSEQKLGKRRDCTAETDSLRARTKMRATEAGF